MLKEQSKRSTFATISANLMLDATRYFRVKQLCFLFIPENKNPPKCIAIPPLHNANRPSLKEILQTVSHHALGFSMRKYINGVKSTREISSMHLFFFFKVSWPYKLFTKSISKQWCKKTGERLNVRKANGYLVLILKVFTSCKTISLRTNGLTSKTLTLCY